MPPSNADQFPEGVRVRRVGHLAQAEVDPFRQDDVHQADPVGAGRSRAQMGEGLTDPVAASTSSRRSVIRVGGICAQVRLAQAAMAQRDTSVSDLCKELGIERVTLYRYVDPRGELRDHGKHVLGLA